MGTDLFTHRVEAAVRRGREWLAQRPGDRVGQDIPGSSRASVQPTRPVELLRAGPRTRDLLDAAVPSADPAADGWDSVLAALAVLAVRADDLDALAAVLLCAGRFGLTDDPVLRSAAGYLCAQQHADGAFGEPVADTDVGARRSVTRQCVAALDGWL